MNHDDNKYETGPLGRKIEQLVSLERFKGDRARLFESLTEREREVLRLVALGMKTSEVARQLGVSSVTAQNHRANVRQKLAIRRDSDYFRYAIAFDLVEF